jgi:RNA polymerase sigma-70 factor (ECF subfamily)
MLAARMNADENRILASARAGDEAAFNELMAAHGRDIRAYLYRMTACREDAEDLAQVIWVRVYRNLAKFEGRSSFRTWLFAIATSAARDHHRARQRWPVDAQDRARTLAESGPETAEAFLQVAREAEAGRYEIREHIDFCLTCIMKSLPLEQQLAVMLADLYGFTAAEGAEIIGVTLGVFKHLLHDARVTLERVFEHRCALISKTGMCHQCSELNGFFNPAQDQQAELARNDLVRAAADADRRNLLDLRLALARGIHPLHSDGADVQEAIMRVVWKANAS